MTEEASKFVEITFTWFARKETFRVAVRNLGLRQQMDVVIKFDRFCHGNSDQRNIAIGNSGFSFSECARLGNQRTHRLADKRTPDQDVRKIVHRQRMSATAVLNPPSSKITQRSVLFNRI
jgi:hypothetical protein